MLRDGTIGIVMYGAAAATLLLGVIQTTPSSSQGDPLAEGEKLYKRCAACHAIGQGAKNKVGPELNGIIGRVAGSVPDYSYSDAMKAAGTGGLVWTAETLATYLESPKAMVPGTKMAFSGLRKPNERDAVIAYIVQAGSTP
jgi:cytochrome c